MQKNWYIIYTKSKGEKKIATLLTKKKIENFLPLNLKKVNSYRKQKNFQEPLFKSYLFAKLDESEIGKIKSFDGVLNFLYWKDSPAVIKEEEIKAIKEFTIDYQNISIEKMVVNLTNFAQVIDMTKYSFNGNVLSIKNSFAKLSLPSLGFTLVANIETFDQFDSMPSFANKKLIVQS